MPKYLELSRSKTGTFLWALCITLKTDFVENELMPITIQTLSVHLSLVSI